MQGCFQPIIDMNMNNMNNMCMNNMNIQNNYNPMNNCNNIGFMNINQMMPNQVIAGNWSQMYTSNQPNFGSGTDLNPINRKLVVIFKTGKRHSASTEKNKNQLSIYMDYKYSKFRNKENIPSNDIKNILLNNDNCSKYEIPSPLYKDKIILEHEMNKSLRSMNQLNSINISKNQEIYSKSSNISKGQSDDNNNIVYKNVQDIQRIKDEIENKKSIKKAKKEKSYSNQIINNKNGNSFHEVNLNYVNNFCIIS